ncbi:MAG TPA: glycoside hydrolase family 3 C-terminal domain-containing protein, partial [Acidimicrobiia bacterium]|nr:glycoside hydrolase family 3 C-terminal domain-containing protein [Acidimicrobiia bacterium]
LAPTVNLHRSPRGGRHFEAFSEDPELTARMAVAYITGVQSKGVAACIKHYVGNDQEHERFTIDAHIDDRTLREVYLRPFEAAVAEADVRTVMAAYNFVNGQHACAQRDLLLGVLKGEWAFDGVAMSDWNAMKGTVEPAVSGLDLEMPGPGRWWGGAHLLDAVVRGDVTQTQLDDKVCRILRLLQWRRRLPGITTTADERSVDRPEHRALARRAAAEGMVLLQNDGLLPLPPGRSVALIGPGVQSTALLGGGSALLEPHRHTNVGEVFRTRWAGEVREIAGVELRRSAATLPAEWIGADGVTVDLFDGRDFTGEPFASLRRAAVYNVWWDDGYPAGHDAVSVRLRFTLVPQASGRHRLVGAGYGTARLYLDGRLVADSDEGGFPAGFGFSAGSTELELEAGRAVEVALEAVQPPDNICPAALVDIGVASVDLSAGLDEAASAAAAADVAVVVVGSNDEWESEGSDRRDLELPAGQSDLVRRVLAANPNTVVVLNCGAPMLLPWLDDVPAALLAWYPGQEGAEAIVDVLIGEAEPGGRMPTTWARHERDTPSFLHYPGEAGVVRYGEELFVGHRWYDARGIEPLIPFGHGGSYTTFEWGTARVTGEGVDLVVEVDVANVGARAGSDVVQVYVSFPETTVPRPRKQLAGFAKVHLQPGQQGVARIELSEAAFRRWDVATASWSVDPGRHELLVAASAADVRETVSVTIANL